jgi:hypothetical protein
MITLKHNLELLEQIGESYESGKDGLNSLSILNDEIKERDEVYSTLVSLRDKACVTLQKLDATEVLNAELLEALIKIRDFDENSGYDDPGQIAIEVITKATQS